MKADAFAAFVVLCWIAGLWLVGVLPWVIAVGFGVEGAWLALTLLPGLVLMSVYLAVSMRNSEGEK